MRRRYASTELIDLCLWQSVARSDQADFQMTITQSEKLSTYVRGVVVLAALAILFIRMPPTFLKPAFWGEDALLFRDAYVGGWRSLWITVSGYLLTEGRVIAWLASFFPPITAPWIYAYTAHATLLFVAWLAMSPRLELPYKPILALALVCSPGATEVIGALINTQWTLSIGALLLMYFRPAQSPAIFVGECLLAVGVAIHGPFAIFLAPLYLARLAQVWRDELARRRMTILIALMSVGAALQSYYIMANAAALGTPPATQPHGEWLALEVLPYRFFDTIAPLNLVFLSESYAAVVLSVQVTVGLIILAIVAPHRRSKMALLLFACAILFSGMLKARFDLNTMVEFQHRYIYAGSVVTIWIIACFADAFPRFRFVPLAIAIAMLANGLRLSAGVTRETIFGATPPWSDYANRIGKEPLTIPTSPPGWSITLPGPSR
jgi:hypothetical protein